MGAVKAKAVCDAAQLTDEERVWLGIAKALPPPARSLLIQAAEAIAEGRRPPPSPFRQANPEALASASGPSCGAR